MDTLVALDLRKFVWLNRETKKSYLILGIVDYKDEDFVVYREAQDRSNLQLDTVDSFCKQHDATYELN